MGEYFTDGRDPVISHQNVVVSQAENRSVRGSDARVERRPFAVLRLMHGQKTDGESLRGLGDHLRRRIAAAVIDNDDFVAGFDRLAG